jgi:uncharacterized repeat protein (TIGR03803 family)
VASATYTITPVVTPVAATPVFSPAAGTYSATQTVSISDATAGAAIYYTTNGSAPTASSTNYTGAITVSNTETIEAIAVASGYSNSPVASATYTITAPPTFCIRVSPTGSILYSFGATVDNGSAPEGLVQGPDGTFYGTTQSGGNNQEGSLFTWTPAAQESALYSFNGSTPDGLHPRAPPILGTDGNLYGTTYQGGANGAGTVYRISPSGIETVLYSFGTNYKAANGNTTDGANPAAALVQGSDGNFYGTTTDGGASTYGTVFQITPTGTETVLYSFNPAGVSNDGVNPSTALVQGTDGNFYGTTPVGGAGGGGNVFKVTPDGVETVLYAFGASAAPNGLILGSDGNFYGTTQMDGANNGGTVFEITPAGAQTTLYSFKGISTSSDGAFPSGLIQGTDGNFYGITTNGGANGVGTVFELTPNGVETLLYSFASETNNSLDVPVDPNWLIQGNDGNLYGTALQGGNQIGSNGYGGSGAIFKVTICN